MPTDFTDDWSRWFWLAAGQAALLVVGFALVLLRRRGKAPPAAQPNLRIDLAQLSNLGPPPGDPRLEFYGVPVRLAVLVLAPAGRGSTVPDGPSLKQALESLVPGLVEIVKLHRPLICGWPCQLSTQGFTNVFFTNVALPGDHGKGTPWCAVAGRFEAGAQHLLAGLVCVADKPNSLSQITIQQLGQWLDVLRVKHG